MPNNNNAANVAVQKRKRRPRRGHPILSAIFTVFISLVLIAVLTVTIVGSYVAYHVANFVEGEAAINLDDQKAGQSKTTIIYGQNADGEIYEMYRLHGVENRIWVNIDEIPEDLQNAFIALEDKRFYEHSGVDWRRTVSSALVYNFEQGGSTITQQLIKNLTNERDRTLKRKYNEILRALNLEKHYSKNTILETYLNTLYLDGGCYGVKTASEYYFGKNVSDLNLAECAAIASITKEPATYDPIKNPDENRDRRTYCLKMMLEQGYITQSRYDEAIATELKLIGQKVASEDEDEPEEEETKVPSYYVDFVIKKVIRDFEDVYGYSYSEAWNMVYKGGLKIYAAQDDFIQNELEDVYINRKGFPDARNSKGEKVQSCMVIMDYSGRVLGLVGQADEKTGAMTLNIATDAPRQPGSSIKPLSVYSYAIDSGDYTWSYPLIENYGIKIKNEYGEFVRWPYNFGGDPGGAGWYETIQAALAPSHNTVPVQILKDVGVETCYNWLRNTFHISTLTDTDNDYAPLGVGGMTKGVLALDMCAAYATFGNGGAYYDPYCYYRVTNASGSRVYLTHNDTGEQIMAKSTAQVMNKLLQTVVTSYNGTGRNFSLDRFESFAKTGTTTDEKDRWYVGASPYYVCAAWMGYSENPEELDFETNYLGRIYQRVMNDIHEDLPRKSFTFDDSIVRREFCENTGKIASSGCYDTSYGWYRKDVVPPRCNGDYDYRPEDESEDFNEILAQYGLTLEEYEAYLARQGRTETETTTASSRQSGSSDDNSSNNGSSADTPEPGADDPFENLLMP